MQSLQDANSKSLETKKRINETQNGRRSYKLFIETWKFEIQHEMVYEAKIDSLITQTLF